ncbi:AraC family ligand binding domain-containing protein [Alcaligenes faecalis]|uniref:AraC family ligand binding domain-containing protein n=1 Tax=Alcaligenes faecalis TaxID=511 RepID=UPI003A0FE76C
MPISGLAADYPDGHLIQEHQHVRAQFLYAVQGVMVIDAQEGRWVVPPSRGVWLQPGRPHTYACVGRSKCARSLWMRMLLQACQRVTACWMSALCYES